MKDLAEFSLRESSGNGRTGSSKASPLPSPPRTGDAIMRLKGEGGALEGRQLSAGVPPPSRRDLKLSSRLSVQVQAGRGGSWWVLERIHARLKITEESYFHFLLMTGDVSPPVAVYQRCSPLITSLMTSRERSLEECSLTFAEEVINTSPFR